MSVASEYPKAQSRQLEIRAMQRWRGNSLRLNPATLDAIRIGERAKEREGDKEEPHVSGAVALNLPANQPLDMCEALRMR